MGRVVKRNFRTALKEMVQNSSRLRITKNEYLFEKRLVALQVFDGHYFQLFLPLMADIPGHKVLGTFPKCEAQATTPRGINGIMMEIYGPPVIRLQVPNGLSIHKCFGVGVSA